MENVFKLYKGTKIKKTLAIILICSCYSCASIYNADYKKPELVDKLASNSVKELHKKLHLIAEKGFAVGHQDATSYGIGWRHENNSTIIKSDVNEVAGDFPAVFGFDIGGIEHANEYNLDSVPFNDMRKLMIDAYKKGGIITISWHADNPVSGGNAWDKTPAVANILIGGNQREKYELWIDRVADFLQSLQYNGENIPIIFRPFHEMNGSWFWWGEGNCQASDYIKLWQETVVLLRDKHNLHNVLYTYSPNKLNPNDNYMKYYSGDDYVDILGIDIYDFNNSEEYIKSMVHDLALVKSIASEKEKLFAFTETGLEKIPTEKWFTEVLYPNLENSGISWVLFWRNYKTTHHYMPYKGHSSEADFIKFEKLPKTLFLRDIKNINN
jgi:mannan endo-1,4-beta-mannosidase